MPSGLSTTQPLASPAIDWIVGDVPGPRLGQPLLEHAVDERYGLRGALSLIAFERDYVYRLDDVNGTSWIVRVSPAREAEGALTLQNAALRAVARNDPELPVPRIRASVYGNDVEPIDSDGGHFRLRVLTFLPGSPCLSSPRSAERLLAVGRALARLDIALHSVPRPATFPLLWDIRSAPQLRPFGRYILRAQHRHLVDKALANLEERALTRLAELPAQVIHNDFNPKNILFGADDASVSGIIDFGDMLYGARATDVGVTMARHLEAGAVARASSIILTGYCAISALSSAEVDSLYSIVCARLAMRSAIGSWRLHQADGRGDPAQIADALALLVELDRIGEAVLTQAWREHASHRAMKSSRNQR